jgi:hypothetical protein
MAVEKWTNTLLDPMRQVADPPADKVVAAIIDSGGTEAVNAMMRHIVGNRDVVPESLPKIVQDFLTETEILPDWADKKLIKKGEKVFDLNGPEMIMMLFFVSLPYAYATKRGSHVLSITAELTRHVHRRIFRTAQFIMDVMQKGGLTDGGRGVRSAQKVRLIHASIRHYMHHNPKWSSEWDSEWGLPINQEDMAGTLMDFAAGVMRGLDRAGIPLDPDEAEAYLHCWKVVGHIIGVSPELMPENVPDAFDLANTIIARQKGESNSGAVLSKDLIQFIQKFMFGKFFLGFPATATRVLSGDEVADTIHVDRSDWTRILLWGQFALFKLAERFERRLPRGRKWIRFMTWTLIEKAVLFEEGGQGTSFEIPDDLADSWNVSKKH